MIVDGINYPRSKDITGKKFNHLTAIKPVRFDLYGDSGKHRVIWLWKCDCGTILERFADRVKSGHIKSCGCHVGLPKGESSFNSLYYHYKYQAMQRGLSFELDKDTFRKITQQNCYYCNEYPKQNRGKEDFKGIYIYNGVDRVDPTKGYCTDNIVPCCGYCNRAKLAMSRDRFLQLVGNIYFHRVINSDLQLETI